MAEKEQRPDKYSDHDFIIITKNGYQEKLKQNLEWLPDNENLIYDFKESKLAVKAIYEYGHIVEFIVADQEELKDIPLNTYKIMFDKSNLDDLLKKYAKNTENNSKLQISNERLIGQIIFDLKIGIDRYLRGEHLSAFKKIKCLCVERLLILIQKNINTKIDKTYDNLDPFRRVELLYPTFGKKIENVIESSIYEVSLTILFFLKNEFNIKLDDDQKEAVKLIINYINDNKDKLGAK